MILGLFLYLLLMGAWLLGLALGLGFMLFPEKIMKWGERHFTDYQQWYQQSFERSWIYKYFGIKIKSRKFFIWSFRIWGAGVTILSGWAVFQLFYWLFKPLI